MKGVFLLLLSLIVASSTLVAQNRPAPVKPTPPAKATPAAKATPVAKATPAAKSAEAKATPKPASQPVETVKPKVLTEDLYKKLVKDTIAMKAGRDEIKKMEYMKKLAATSYEASFKLAPSRETNMLYFKFTLEIMNNDPKSLRLNLCYSGAVSSEGKLWSYTEQIFKDINADDNLIKRMKNGTKNFTVKVVFKFNEKGLNEFTSFKRDHGEVMVSGSKTIVSYKIYDGASLLYDSGKQ